MKTLNVEKQPTFRVTWFSIGFYQNSGPGQCALWTPRTWLSEQTVLTLMNSKYRERATRR